MVRIMYTWRVSEPQQNTFIQTWIKTTTQIHKEVKGARGSFMIRSETDPSIIKTIARWDSAEDWKRFWQNANPSQMEEMNRLGDRLSAEVFEEIDDFTS
ncbi:MAG: antibiotic biosynthesis monooxygenase [Bacteroidota bacterium]